MRKVIYILYIVCFSLLLVGCGVDQAVKKGDRFWAVGEYYDAAEQYKKAYTQTPNKERTTRGQRAKKLAECYRRLNQTNKAISAYNNVVRYKQADSLTHLYLGQLYMRNGNYKEAAKQFAVAVDSLQCTTDSANLQLAKTGLESAQKAPQWKKEGSAYTIKKMDLFNSRRDDYSPMLAGDADDQLYFTSTRNQAQGDEGREGQMGQATDHRHRTQLSLRRGRLLLLARWQDNVPDTMHHRPRLSAIRQNHGVNP